MTEVKPVEARDYGGETAATRAARRRAALVAAAFDLVSADGWRALRIDAVCRHAQLNKRYFYESFPGLDALIGAVMHQVAEDTITATLAALGPSGADDAGVRRGITAFVTHLTDDPRRARVLFGAVPAGDDAARHRDAAIHRLIATVAAQGRSHHALPDHPVVQTTAAMLIGGTSQAVLDWVDGHVTCSRAEFVDHLTALWLVLSDGAAARVRA